MTTQIVGILNLTPDSFSDGGLIHSIDHAVKQVDLMIEQGADIIDIGAQSTRPGALEITDEEEWLRLSPYLPEIRRNFPGLIISLDTYHPKTAKLAIECGVNWINDVSGGLNPHMQDVIQQSGCMAVLMHSLSVPVDPGIIIPEQANLISVIADWVSTVLEKYDTHKTILDIGVGFGKSPIQSWELLRRADEWLALHPQWLVGHSRKSFFGKQINVLERDLETHIVSTQLALKNVPYLRVHDVAGTRRALAVAKELA